LIGQDHDYPKSKKDDLSDQETAILRELVKEL
jgi:hypothetical protein